MTKTVNIPPNVRAVLARASVAGNVIHLPSPALDRDLYKAVDLVLKAMGGKWNKKAGGHLFANGVGDQLREALADGSVVDRKKTLELFETPEHLAKRMAEIAAAVSDHLPRNIVFLEPSAGRGRLIRAFSENLDTNEKDIVIAFDIDVANCDEIRRLDMARDILCLDFIKTMPSPTYPMADVILMNPPFSKNQDIKHVMHAYTNWLAAGGILVAIMSAHWTFSQDAPSRKFWKLMDQKGFSAEHLPAGTFKESGTGVSTVMVTMRKGEF